MAAGRAAADDQALAAGLDGLKIAYLSLGDTGALADVLAELQARCCAAWVICSCCRGRSSSDAFLAIAAADWDQAAAAIETAIELNRQAAIRTPEAWYVAHLGWLARLRGRLDEAMALGRQAVELTEQHEHAGGRPTACAMLGDTVLLTGDRAGAIALFERGLTAAQQAGRGGLPAALRWPRWPPRPARGRCWSEAAGLLERASIPDGGAWMLGYEAYLSLAEAWLAAR